MGWRCAPSRLGGLWPPPGLWGRMRRAVGLCPESRLRERHRDYALNPGLGVGRDGGRGGGGAKSVP